MGKISKLLIFREFQEKARNQFAINLLVLASYALEKYIFL